VIDRPGALGEDLRAGREPLELGRRREPPELGRLERVERRMGAEEVRDLLDAARPSDVSVHRTLRLVRAAGRHAVPVAGGSLPIRAQLIYQLAGSASSG